VGVNLPLGSYNATWYGVCYYKWNDGYYSMRDLRENAFFKTKEHSFVFRVEPMSHRWRNAMIGVTIGLAVVIVAVFAFFFIRSRRSGGGERAFLMNE